MKGLVLRLYFVDTPETNLTYGERTRQQAAYFGASLDDTLKAGAQARVKGVAVNIPGGEKARARSQRLLLLEEHAKQKRRGLWNHSSARAPG